MTEVSRRGCCLSKSFKNASRGPSLETTVESDSVLSSNQHTLASSGVSPILDASTTLVFVDWDDTLFPSTEIFDRWGFQLRSETDHNDHITAEQQRLLGLWRKSLQRFVMAMVEFSQHCAIVTNAEAMWVENCLHRFAPEVLEVIEEQGGPTILHAKDVLRSLRSKKIIWQHDEICLSSKTFRCVSWGRFSTLQTCRDVCSKISSHETGIPSSLWRKDFGTLQPHQLWRYGIWTRGSARAWNAFIWASCRTSCEILSFTRSADLSGCFLQIRGVIFLGNKKSMAKLRFRWVFSWSHVWQKNLRHQR